MNGTSLVNVTRTWSLFDDLNVGIGADVAAGQHASLVGFERDHASRFAVIAHNQALDVQNDLRSRLPTRRQSS